MNKKGQGVIIGLLFFFIAIAMVSILAEPLMEFVAVGVNATESSPHGALMGTIFNYIPVFLVLMLFVVGILMMTGKA